MDQRSVFFEEWIRSLREQYKHVLRQDDRVTLPTLTAVMTDVGFSDEELAQLRAEAARRVDEPGSDLAADMAILEHTLPHAAECRCPLCSSIDEGPLVANERSPSLSAKQGSMAAGSAFPAAAPAITASKDADDEPDPQTFEDSLAARENDASDGVDDVDADDDEAEVDRPQQMSLF